MARKAKQIMSTLYALGTLTLGAVAYEGSPTGFLDGYWSGNATPATLAVAFSIRGNKVAFHGCEWLSFKVTEDKPDPDNAKWRTVMIEIEPHRNVDGCHSEVHAMKFENVADCNSIGRIMVFDSVEGIFFRSCKAPRNK